MPSRSAATSVLLAAAMLVAVAACHDSTAPRPHLDVTVTATSSRGPYFSTDSLGNPRITCYVDFTAAALGTGTAHWLGASYRFYYGKTRTTPTATFPMSASDIASGWQSDSIVGGAGERSTWYFSGGIPFSGEFEFHYAVGTDTVEKHATARFTCGPEVSDSTPLPVIDTTTIVPPSGILPAGAPLTVSYQASSGVGIWQTALQITGPCVYQKVYFEQLQHSVAHEISVPMDTTCLHDVPVYVHVFVVDAAAQGVEEVITSPVVIEDRVPLGGGPLLLPTRVPELQALGDAQLAVTTARLPFRFDAARPGRPLTIRRAPPAPRAGT